MRIYLLTSAGKLVYSVTLSAEMTFISISLTANTTRLRVIVICSKIGLCVHVVSKFIVVANLTDDTTRYRK